MANLTGNDIKDTYSKLLQKDGSAIQDGLGNTVNIADIYAAQISGSFTETSASLALEVDSLQLNSSSYVTTGSNILIGNQIITGSVTVTGSLNSEGTARLRQTTSRISFQAIASDIGTNGNISIQRFEDGTTSAKVYGDVIQLGAFSGDFIDIGNTGSYTSINGQFIAITGSSLLTGSSTIVGNLTVTGSVKINGSSLLTLTPLNPLPSSPETGSLAVTGSTLAFYDGNNWKVVMTGSILL